MDYLAEDESGRPTVTHRYRTGSVADTFWGSTCAGIATWAGMFVAIPFVLLLLFQLVLVSARSGLEPGFLLLVALFGIGGALATAVAALILSWMVCLPVTWLARTIQVNEMNLVLATFTGGLTVLVGLTAFPGIFVVLAKDPESAVVFFILLMTATVFGQLGASRGAVKSLRARKILSKEALSISPRFKITHLLWAMVVLSIPLATIKSLGLPIERILLLLIGWLVFQTITLLVVVHNARRVLERAD